MSICSTAPEGTIVSHDDELLILVDSDDQPIGSLDKAACHDGDGVLHRAFSAFIFNADAELLLQKRAASKRLWGGYWSNSCCSHPRVGEATDYAVERRIQQELGMTADMRFIYKFEYHARFGTAGSEHELCWVYVGTSLDEPQANPTEISAHRWVSVATLDDELAANPDDFTPWFKLEWKALGEAGLLPSGS